MPRKLFKTLRLSSELNITCCSVLQNISESIVALVTKEGTSLSVTIHFILEVSSMNHVSMQIGFSIHFTLTY